jgi:hypothetical protein
MIAKIKTKLLALSFVQVADTWDANDPNLQEVLSKADCVIHTAGPYFEQSPYHRSESRYSSWCKSIHRYFRSVTVSGNGGTHDGPGGCRWDNGALVRGSFSRNEQRLGAPTYCQHQSCARHSVSVLYRWSRRKRTAESVYYQHRLRRTHGTVFNGQLRFYTALLGRLLGRVDFFMDKPDKELPDFAFGNQAVRQRVGRQKVFAWPFPEGTTVSKQLTLWRPWVPHPPFVMTCCVYDSFRDRGGAITSLASFSPTFPKQRTGISRCRRTPRLLVEVVIVAVAKRTPYGSP